jgi:hypothetical protein
MLFGWLCAIMPKHDFDCMRVLQFPGEYFAELLKLHCSGSCIVTCHPYVTVHFALSVTNAISVHPCDKHFSHLNTCSVGAPSGYSAGRLKEPTVPCALLRSGVLRDVIEMCLLVILNSHLIPIILFILFSLVLFKLVFWR